MDRQVRRKRELRKEEKKERERIMKTGQDDNDISYEEEYMCHRYQSTRHRVHSVA